jgi:uncharacterized protein
VSGKVVVIAPASSSPLVLDSEAVHLLESFTLPRSVSQVQELLRDWNINLLERAIALFIAFHFISPVGRREDLQIVSSESYTLSAWLHLTDACPLQCVYCYVRGPRQRPSDQGKTRWMNPDTVRRAVEAIFRSATIYGFSEVKLKYAGGDPSLNFTAMLAAQKHAEQLASASGLALDAVLMSSGFFLNDHQIDILQEHGVHVSISLDGIGEIHDNQRPLVNGRGSFQHVSRTIEKLITRGITPHISITISGRNIDALSATLSYVLDHDLPFTLNFYREHDASANMDSLQASEEKMIAGLQSAFAVIEARLPRYQLLSSIADRIDLRVPHAYTCGVGRNYLVIDPLGNISKCQMAMDMPIAHISTKDPLSVIKTDRRGVQNPSVDEKEGCKDCTWRYYCAGGCPLLTCHEFGRYDTRSPYCSTYQAIMPQILRLEALRLLQYEKPWDCSA